MHIPAGGWGVGLGCYKRILSPICRSVSVDAHLSRPPGRVSSPKRGAAYPESMSGPPDSYFALHRIRFSCLHCYRRAEGSPSPFTHTTSIGGLFSVTLSVATGCPTTSFSRGIRDGVRTFLSSIRTSEHPHAEADAQHPAGEALEKQVWSKGVGSMVGCFAREQAGLLLRYPYLHAKILP